MNETKMMSFEEWDNSRAVDWHDTEPHERRAEFDRIRQGTIPADRAVEIPRMDFLEDGSWRFTYKGSSLIYDFDGVNFILRIPEWVPQVGEAVFFANLTVGVPVSIGIIEGKIAGWFTIRKSDGKVGEWDIEHMKPFDATKIGKPWGEI